MKTLTISVGLAAMLTMSSPALAQSQRSTRWVVAPFLGSTSGGDATQAAATVGISGQRA